MKGATRKQISEVRGRLERFSEAMCYSCNLNDIIIYINELKSRLSPWTYRKYVVDIRRLLRLIDPDIAGRIKLPNTPKRREIVIHPHHVRKLVEQAEQLRAKSERLRLKAGILVSATSGIRAEELYKLTLNDIDVEDRTIYIKAEIAKDYEDRVAFFSEEAKQALKQYLEEVQLKTRFVFARHTMIKDFRKLKVRAGTEFLRMKHMRKFFSQQSDRLGMPTAIKKILMGHSLRGDVDLSHYDFQDEEELKRIYDKYWKDFRISF